MLQAFMIEAAHPPSTLIAFAPLISAVGSLILGGAGIAVAVAQWRIARTKVQMDLYSLRVPIYDATRRLLGHMTGKGVPSLEEIIAFEHAVERAPFHFDGAFALYLKELADLAFDLRMNTAIVPIEDGPARKDAIARQLQGMTKLREAYEQLPQRFAPYLELAPGAVRRGT